MTGLRLLFIGESIVLAGAIETARRRGHQVLAVFATVPAEAAAMARAGLPVEQAANAADFIERHDCDVLFSIINGHILSAETLARPRIAAINYHNAPLPRYAGLWATAWAVLNAEVEHGITWHLMEPGIDTGAILAQRRFPLAPEETTASLNIRCSAAAVDGLADVFDALERGELSGRPQDLARRTYHRRGDTVPHGGRIDWRWPAERILRLVRACDWGATPGEFGKAIVVTAHAAIAVRSAGRADGAAAPGFVLAAEGASITIGCGDGAVRLVLEQDASVEAGSSLPLLDLEAGGAVAPPGLQAAPQPVASEIAEPTIIESIAALAIANPHAPAIEDGPRVVTRGALDAGARAVAAALLAAGLRRDDGVGILLPSGVDFVTAALGAMIAGGAYVPLDPSIPHARHLVEIDEAGITHVVTHSSRHGDLPGVAVIAIDKLDAASATPPLSVPSLADCAYRIFTSGSTGRPKAVEIGHAALSNLAAHYRFALPMRPSDRMTMLAHPTFDASVADIWPVLAGGGVALVAPRHTLRDPPGLIEWLAGARATSAFVPTAIAERLLDLRWPAHTTLKVLLTGGDTLHRRPPPGLPFRLINTYGPTENTVDSLWADIGPGSGRPPIGRPIAGVTATIVDAAGTPVRPGETGELMLGGVQVARGYRGRPELTAARFTASDTPGAPRLYRTGDRARMDADGVFEFHGRIDDQVQLLGIRVEPGEIEALLKADPRVAEAACLPLRTGETVTGLAAFVVPRDPSAPHTKLVQDLLTMLKEQLPTAIVPGRLDLCDALPRTAAGKVDRLALSSRAVTDVTTLAMVETSAADPIGALWRRSLPPGAQALDEEDFWNFGGNSLAAIEMLVEVERISGVRVSIGLFLADATLGALRREIVVRRNPLVVRLREGAGPPLVLWYGVSGDLEHYQGLVARLEDREIIGVRSPAVADASLMPSSLEDAVASGLSALRRFGVFETPAVLGYSWSGLLAFEAARQLSAAGTPPQFVGLVGTVPPFTRRGRAARLALFARAFPVAAWRTLLGRQSAPVSLRSSFRRLLRLWSPEGDLPARPAWATQPLHDEHLRMGQRYHRPRTSPSRSSCFARPPRAAGSTAWGTPATKGPTSAGASGRRRGQQCNGSTPITWA